MTTGARSAWVTLIVGALLSACLAPVMAGDAVAPPPPPGGAGAEGPARAGAGRFIVLCAPGMPGNTVQAQPTMDQFAGYVEKAAGWPAGTLGAVYYETEKGGLERFAAKDAALALVPVPFFLEHGAKLGLKPLLQVEQESGPNEEWSLVARKGQLPSAAALAGWELTGMPGYSPAFVRGPVLGRWGAVPPTAKITFSAGALSALRRAASGEKVAVILDRAGAASLASLPFGKDLEVVAKSKPVPASVLCSVGDRFGAAETAKLTDALLGMSKAPAGTELLTTMRIRRFVPLDRKALDAAREAFKAASAPSKP